jgi:hypothetical protein
MFSLIVSLDRQFDYFYYRIRVIIVVMFSLASFLIVGLSVGVWMSIIGELKILLKKQ